MNMLVKSLILQIGFALISFLILYGIFKVVKRRVNPLRKWYFWTCWAVVTPLLYFLIVVAFMNYSFPPRASVEFSSDQWIQNKEIRIQMIDDLIDKQLLDSKNEEQVVTILGIPEEDSPYFQSTDRELIYYLGRESGIGVDSEWLLIWFENGRVSSYRVTTD